MVTDGTTFHPLIKIVELKLTPTYQTATFCGRISSR